MKDMVIIQPPACVNISVIPLYGKDKRRYFLKEIIRSGVNKRGSLNEMKATKGTVDGI